MLAVHEHVRQRVVTWLTVGNQKHLQQDAAWVQ